MDITNAEQIAAYDAETARLNAAKDARRLASTDVRDCYTTATLVPITAAQAWDASQERLHRHEAAARNTAVVGIR